LIWNHSGTIIFGMSKSPFFSVGKLPNKHKSSQYRLRFKNHKGLGVRPDGVFGGVHHFPSRKEAEEFGQSKIDEVLSLGTVSRKLSQQAKEDILRIAARLEQEGQDPVAAIEEGAKQLKILGRAEQKLLSEFWEEYFTSKSETDWCSKEIINQRAFRRNAAESFFLYPLKDFISSINGREIVRKALYSHMRGKRKATNTAKLFLAKMASFLRFLSTKSERITPAHVGQMFYQRAVLLPKGLKPEAENVKFTPEQSLHVIRGMAEKGYAAYIVFKLFMGARTLQLHRWAWEIVNWKDELIFIPKKETKNKKGDISFGFAEIPNFKAWIEWAYEKEGRPDAKQKIISHSQPTVNKKLTAIFNADRNLFKFCDGKTKISGSAHARNVCRSTFISYGIEVLNQAVTSRVAEDEYCLGKYIDRGKQATAGSDAKAFFQLHPRDLKEVTSS
jgi:hypothetical protein